MTEPSDKQPPEGSHVVKPLTAKLTLATFPAAVKLRQYIDTSSEEAEKATTTALSEIAAWISESKSLDVKHVIDGNLTPSKAGVPVGPFDDDLVRKIVKTIFDDAEARRADRWDLTKSVITWLFSVASLILVAFGVWLAYLKFFSDN